MNRRKGLLEWLADGADLSEEALPGKALVELVGDRRVLVENHRGVTQYSRERIGIRLQYGMIMVSGSGLELARMSKEQLIITGRIDGITLCRR